MSSSRLQIFLSSVFFVLGFSVIFSVIGILLQTVLVHSSHVFQMWLGWVGGIIIILFGLFLVGLFTPSFLERTHTFAVKKRFNSSYLTSFLFGAAFAAGWTPCVSAALGAILGLAASQPGSAFLLLFAYTIGIGFPFLVVGLFTAQAQVYIQKAEKWLVYIQYIFGVLLIIIGIFVFTNNLSAVANVEWFTNVLTSLHLTTTIGGDIQSLTIINVIIAFLAGLGSFLSPCILPIVPGFLSYVAGTAISKTKIIENVDISN